jgi:hypothetical protein
VEKLSGGSETQDFSYFGRAKEKDGGEDGTIK